MKKILQITILMLSVLVMNTGVVFAETVFSPTLNIDNTVTGKITVTVSASLDNETILDSEKPALSIPCEFEKAHVEFDGKTIESTLVDGEITFAVEKSGSYVIVKDENNNVKPQRPSTGGSSVTRYEIKVQETEGGKITPGTSKIKRGEDLKLKIEAEEGYEIEDVLVDGKSVGITSSYTFEDIKEKHTIEAKFKKISENLEETKWENPFKDVNETDWFYESIKYANENKLFNGVTEDKFSPNTSMTRGMVATVLWRLENEPVVNYLMLFEDIEKESYYEEAIRWATSEKIVNGYSDISFKPNENISREQLVTILHRYAKYKNMDVSVGENTNILSYDDFNELSEYAISAMQWGTGSKVINGKTISTLAPKDTATRAEVATMIMRFRLWDVH